MPSLEVIVADGRYGLKHAMHQYDLIGIDAYRPHIFLGISLR
jgi:spermidine synthase